MATRSEDRVLDAIGLAVAGIAAAVSSWSGQRSLARRAGWGPWQSMLLPVVVDALAVTATRVWLDPDRPAQARRYARRVAVGSIAASLAGNGLEHALAAKVVHQTPRITWVIVVGVASAAPIALALIAHLWHLSRDSSDQHDASSGSGTPHTAAPAATLTIQPALQPAEDAAGEPVYAPAGGSGLARTTSASGDTNPPPPAIPAPAVQNAVSSTPARREPDPEGQEERVSQPAPPVDGPEPDLTGLDELDNEVRTAAQQLLAEYAAAHDGKPMTRNGLRIALGVGNDKATLLRRAWLAGALLPDPAATKSSSPSPPIASGEGEDPPPAGDAADGDVDGEGGRHRADLAVVS